LINKTTAALQNAAVVLVAIFIAPSWGYACDSAFFSSFGREYKTNDLLVNAPSEGPFDSSGIALLGRLRLSDIDSPPVSATDIWGYVSPSGREYALLGLSNGTAFIEVTDPASPALLDIIPHVTGCCSDSRVYKGYAYIVSEGSNAGLQIVDLSEIDDGSVTLVTTYRSNGLTNVHNIAINEDSGYAYLCGARTSVSDGGLFVVDLADPIAPEFVGSWSQHYVHDVQVVSYETGIYAGKEIAFAYSGGISSPRLRILDVTQKSSISVLGQTDYANSSFTHQGRLSEDRNYVYLNDEFDEQDSRTVTSTHVIDVRDLANPKFVFAFSSGTTSTDHNLMVKGDFVYEANYRTGLRIFYVPSPNFAEEVGFFDTHPDSDAVGFKGAWGVYPYLPSGNVIVSDIENGLFIFDPSEALERAGAVPVAQTIGMLMLAVACTLIGIRVTRRAQ
jgi:choice-of-anchor B domain-containing protein